MTPVELDDHEHWVSAVPLKLGVSGLPRPDLLQIVRQHPIQALGVPFTETLSTGWISYRLVALSAGPGAPTKRARPALYGPAICNAMAPTHSGVYNK